MTADVVPLTYGGPALPTRYFAQLDLSAYGDAGATVEKEWKWTGDDTAPVKFASGNVLFLVTPEGMDAGGEFKITIEADVQGYTP